MSGDRAKETGLPEGAARALGCDRDHEAIDAGRPERPLFARFDNP